MASSASSASSPAGAGSPPACTSSPPPNSAQRLWLPASTVSPPGGPPGEPGPRAALGEGPPPRRPGGPRGGCARLARVGGHAIGGGEEGTHLRREARDRKGLAQEVVGPRLEDREDLLVVGETGEE